MICSAIKHIWLLYEKNRFEYTNPEYTRSRRSQSVSSIEKASETIQSLILSFPIPEEIEHEIYASFDKEGLEYVAVRSSATAEDGADHARAGQLDSSLNIAKDDVIEKVRKCWASLFFYTKSDIL